MNVRISQLEKGNTVSTARQGESVFSSRYVFQQLALVLGLTATLVSLLMLYLLFTQTGSIISAARPLSLFIAGLVILEIVVVGIASFMRHKNRHVISLARQLAEVYLSALKRSRLNPQLDSRTSDE
jgi:predicted Co/Zn/Cd cation transporter (cation efflux family)